MKTMTIKMKSTKNHKSYISYLTVQAMVKADKLKLKRKIKFINKQKRHTKKLFLKVIDFLIQKILYFINILIKCIFWQI